MRKGTHVRTRKMSILVSLLCILGLVVTGVSMRSVKTAAKAAQGFCIVLDAGHGGFDPGAIGPGGVCEDGITLAIVKEAQVLLQAPSCTL